jgi:hypothetical protein
MLCLVTTIEPGSYAAQNVQHLTARMLDVASVVVAKDLWEGKREEGKEERQGTWKWVFVDYTRLKAQTRYFLLPA